MVYSCGMIWYGSRALKCSFFVIHCVYLPSLVDKLFSFLYMTAFSALTLLVGRQEGRPDCTIEWWGAAVVICLEQGADLHMAQLMPLLLTVSCFNKIQCGFTFLVLAHLGSPGKGPLNGCVCVSHT